MPWPRLPEVSKCCICIRDLKTATAIIAVLAIVTSPAVSWAAVRHAYVIRVSCLITSTALKPDVVDVNLNNILSFGFGANAGVGPSCLSKNLSLINEVGTFRSSDTSDSFVNGIRWFGWLVLLADLIVIVASIHLLVRLYRPPDKKAAKVFIITALVAMICSFIYSFLYVVICICKGGAFPVFEFIFALVDLGIWIYFLIVVNSYRRGGTSNPG